MNPTNSSILDPKPYPTGFIMGDFYAIPDLKRKLVVFHKGTILKTCRNEESAKSFIRKERRKKKYC